MKKVTAYLTLSAEGRPDALNEKVNEAIKEGWQPLGGISVVTSDGASQSKEYLFTQALVKYEEERQHFTHFDVD